MFILISGLQGLGELSPSDKLGTISPIYQASSLTILLESLQNQLSEYKSMHFSLSLPMR